MNRLAQVPCPKCGGHKTQNNTSTHGLPNGKSSCCICGGTGTVNIDYPGYRGRSLSAVGAIEIRSTK